MAVIDFKEMLLKRQLSRAEGQMAALAYLREEVANSGHELAANLLTLAIMAIDQDLRGSPPAPLE